MKFLILLFVSTVFAQQEPIVINNNSTYENCKQGIVGPAGTLYFEATCTSVIYPAMQESSDPSQPPTEFDPIETQFTLKSNNTTCDFYNYGVSLMYLTEVDSAPVGDRVALTISDVQSIPDETEAARPQATATSVFDTTATDLFARISTRSLGQRTVECVLERKAIFKP